MSEQLNSNLESVRARIADAAQQAGRTAESIRLVGVTKYVDLETTIQLAAAGCRDLGESRPQMLWDKSTSMTDIDVHWHMIGHLQRNKVKRTVACADLIHSADSQRLLQAISDAGQELEKVVNVLLEVNVSGESAKHGFHSDELPAAIEFVSGLGNVTVKGLMCMAGLASGPDETRREFEQLRSLRDEYQSNVPANVTMKELSMGMSGDFEIAISSGATIVRVGSLLFEGV